MPPGATVIVKTQRVIVNPQTRQVAVILAGPQGPVGAPGPGGTQDYIRADGTVPMIADLILPADPIAALAAIPKSYLQNYAYEKAAADGRFVNADGDTINGGLVIASAASPAVPNGLSFSGSRVHQMINLYGTTYGIGVQSSAMYFRTGGTAQDFAWFGGGVHSDTNEDAGGGRVMMVLRPDGLYLPDPNVQNMVIGNSASSGARIRLHVPSTGDIVYIDFAGNGAAGSEQLYFRAGTVGVLQLEDTVIRSLKPIYQTGQLRLFGGVQGICLAHTAGGYIGIYGAATSVDALGTRYGYMGYPGNTHLYLNNETANGNCYILPGTGTGATILGSANAEQARIDSGGNFLVNKTASATGSAGHELQNSGRAWHTTGTATAYCMVAVIVDGASGNVFVDFRNGATGATRIGSITQSGTAAVAYNTTSHGPHKGNVTDLDDDEAIERVLKWRPVAFQWKLDENGEPSDIGFPQGEVEHGFIAQEMNEINPNAVTPGEGDEADHRAWKLAKVEYDRIANERERIQSDYDISTATMDVEDRPPMPELPELPEKPDDISPFRAWQGDWTKLVPDLAAAMQAVIRQNQALTARVEELERMVR
jgi:hypothetical protein